MAIYVDIKKDFGSFLLETAFESDQEILALLGASGSGKSLTLKCIAGIETPDQGVIVLNGKTLFDSKKRINLIPQKRNVGLLFQNYALFPNMTVEENITLGIKKPKSEKGPIITDMLKKLFIEELRKHYPFQLSGGQQQRAALARILASSPDILMLDEPFSALDSYLRWQLEQELDQIFKNYKTNNSVLYVSHNRDEVYRLCDRIAVLSNGKIENLSDKRALFDNPKTYSAALLTGCKNISSAKRISENKILAEDWGIIFTVPNEIDKTINFIGLRAHHINPCKSMESENCFAYKVVKEIEDTFNSILMLELQDGKSPIRWEMNKESRKNLNDYPYIKVEQKHILILK